MQSIFPALMSAIMRLKEGRSNTVPVTPSSKYSDITCKYGLSFTYSLSRQSWFSIVVPASLLFSSADSLAYSAVRYTLRSVSAISGACKTACFLLFLAITALPAYLPS